MRVEYKAELPADMREALERLQNGGTDGIE